MATEAWYMYENQVPNVAGNVANPVPTELEQMAYCAAGQLTCTAPEYAVVNYVNRQVNSKPVDSSDFLDDKKGQRTGIVGKYTENTLYATKYIGSTVTVAAGAVVRSLVGQTGRYDKWSSARNQFFFGMDLIYKF